MQVDIFDKIRKSSGGPIGQYRDRADGYFAFPKLEGELGPHMRFNGQEVLTWSLNNYLGLANHPEVRRVDAEAAARWGMAYPMGSRMMTGQTALHEKFEQMLAKFEKKEAAFLFNFGYQGILSTIDSCMLDSRQERRWCSGYYRGCVWYDGRIGHLGPDSSSQEKILLPFLD